MDVGGGRRRGPVPLVTVGVLAPYELLLRTELASLGYAAGSVTDAVRMLRRLSDWMQWRELTPVELTPSRLEEFLAFRRAVCRSEPVARRSLGAVIRVLRGDGVVLALAAAGGGAVEELLADYAAYLQGERLAAESVRCYCGQARKFLDALPEPLEELLARLDAARVTAFMVRHAAGADSVWSAKALVTAVRSLLRYLHVDGRIPRLWLRRFRGWRAGGWIPCPAAWRRSRYPRCWPLRTCGPRRGGGTGPFWWCSPGWDCAVQKPPRSG